MLMCHRVDIFKRGGVSKKMNLCASVNRLAQIDFSFGADFFALAIGTD